MSRETFDDEEHTDPHELAKMALARAKDTARNKGFRTRTAPRVKPGVTPSGHTQTQRRDPTTTANSIDRLVAMMGWRSRINISSVLARWTDIVGEDVAAHCQPQKFQDGELTVLTDSTTWATQLRYLLPQIEKRLAQEVGEGVVSAIHIHGPSRHKMKGKWRVQGRGPRDTWG